MGRRDRRRTEAGSSLVDLEDVPDVLDPTGGTATGRVAVSSLLVEEDPEAFQRFVDEQDIEVESVEPARPPPADTAPTEEPAASRTSIDDLTQEADPQQFDQTFLDEDTNLTIQGGFDPVAGTKQVIPRIAYTINYNFVWNPDRERWEPDEGNDGGGPVSLVLATTGAVAPNETAVFETGITTPDLGGDTLIPSIALAESSPGGLIQTALASTDNTTAELAYNAHWDPFRGEYVVVVTSNFDATLDVAVTVLRVEP